MQDALGLANYLVYCWQPLQEEYRSEIDYIKGINNTVADAISCLEYNPNKNVKYLHYTE